jgi:hypothetical protein
MKRFAILSVVFLIAFSVTHAQNQKNEKTKAPEGNNEMKSEKVPVKKTEGTSVGTASKNSFIADFGNISNVEWKRGDNFDEASFTKNGENMTAFYDSNGMLVGSTAPKKFSDLPEKAQKNIKDKYKDYSIGPVIFFDDNDRNDTDMVMWAQQFDDEDLYFVEVRKGAEKLMLKVDPAGLVSLFKKF